MTAVATAPKVEGEPSGEEAHCPPVHHLIPPSAVLLNAQGVLAKGR